MAIVEYYQPIHSDGRVSKPSKFTGSRNMVDHVNTLDCVQFVELIDINGNRF